jgi:hypothetical protein
MRHLSPRPCPQPLLSQRWLPLLVAVAAFTPACVEEQAPPPEELPSVTYSGEVRAMVENNCTGCHYTGGAAPFAFETYDDVVAAAPAMLNAMEAGRMPPWPADPACRNYAEQRVLSAEDLATFQTWVEEDTPEGEATAPITFEPPTFEPTVVASARAPYTPDLGSNGDDYRCFLLDLEFEADSWVVGSTVEPATPAVHHVLVYALDPSQAATAEALDAAEEGEGYACFGGPLPVASAGGGPMEGGMTANLVSQIAAWVPGSVPNIVEGDAGIPVPAGSRVVMQMHYSAAGGAAVPDQTALQLQLVQAPPAFVLRTVPFAISDLDIPAGDDDVAFTNRFTNWSDEPVTISALAGHMHLLGTEIDAMVAKADGSEACGLAIPAWDFDWQLRYQLTEEEPLVVEPGDSVELSCRYDNSAANQPVVDGQQIEPRDVEWGDGSLDEMCLMYATIVTPYQAPPPADHAPCAAAAECFAASDGSYTALMACEGATSGCGLCPLQNGVTCGLGPCLFALANERECLTSCVLSTNAFGGSMDRCLAATCGEAYESLLECADPVLQSGSCDAALADGCGLPTGEAP